MIFVLVIAAPLVLLLVDTVDTMLTERRLRRAERIAADLAEWAAYRAAYLAARPERVAPGRRRRPVFVPVWCPALDERDAG